MAYILVLCFILALNTYAKSLASIDDQSLQSLMSQPVLEPTEIFDHAIRIITSLEKAPTCNRRAAITLIESCRMVESRGSTSPHSNIALDDIKSLFAARLAICELEGAHAAIPSQCLHMLPTRASNKEYGWKCMISGTKCEAAGEVVNSYPKISSSQTKQCLNALESRPQWWTSYSNARQNAVVICHAARAEMEKEEILHTYKGMTEMVVGLNQAASNGMNGAEASLKQQQEFIAVARKIHNQHLQDLQNDRDRIRSGFSDLLGIVRGGVRDLVSRVLQASQQVSSNFDNLHSNINQASDDVDGIRESLQSVHKEAVDDSKHMIESQQVFLQANHEAAIALQTSLQSIQAEEISQLVSMIHAIRTDLSASAQLLSGMHYRQEMFDARLQHVSQQFKDIQISAVALIDAQNVQEHGFASLFQDLHSQINKTHDSVNYVSDRIVRLADIIDAKEVQLQALDFTLGFWDSFRQLVRWIVAVLVGLALAIFNKRWAAIYIVMLVIVTALESWSPSLFEALARHAQYPTILNQTFIPAIAGMCLMLICIILLYKSSKGNHLKDKHQDTQKV